MTEAAEVSLSLSLAADARARPDSLVVVFFLMYMCLFLYNESLCLANASGLSRHRWLSRVLRCAVYCYS